MRHSDEKTIDYYYRVLQPRLAEKAAQSKPLSNPDDFDDFGGGSPVLKGASPAPKSDSDRTNPVESFQLRKGATRHGSPLLEVRWPCDEFPRRLAVWMRIRRIHHDRLCLDFEREARWWAYSASPALHDTFRRDAFPVGKPANTPRELLDSLEEL